MRIKAELAETFTMNVSLFEDTMFQIMQDMAMETKDFWYTIAGQRLKSSRIKYQQALGIDHITSESFEVVLYGNFAYSIEVGTDGPYPMFLEKGKVAPLNVDRDIVFTSPQVWRTGTGEPWMHPGFTGFNMRDDVQLELANEILPRYVDELLGKI